MENIVLSDLEILRVFSLYLGCEVLVPKEQYWTDIFIKKKYGDKDQTEKLQSVSFSGDGTITTSYPEGGFMIFYPEDVQLLLTPPLQSR